MRAMILESVDGQEFARVVIVPESMDILKMDDIARAAIDRAIDARPEDYTWSEDIVPALQNAGFLVPEQTFNGPTWDER